MTRLHCEVKGKGSPLVFLHGFPLSHHIWDFFTDHLALRYQTLAFDLPGFGHSDPPSETFTLEDVAKGILEVLRHRGIDRTMVVAHSMGGYIALAMAAVDPDRMGALALLHSTANADTPDKKMARQSAIEVIRAEGANAFVRNFVPGLFADQRHPAIPMAIEMASGLPPTALIRSMTAMRDRPERREVLKTMGSKLLLMAGEEDKGIPVDDIKEQALLAEGIELAVLPNVAHLGMLENPSGTLEIVRIFAEKCALNRLF